jgi:anti-sigma B factor antagonist
MGEPLRSEEAVVPTGDHREPLTSVEAVVVPTGDDGEPGPSEQAVVPTGDDGEPGPSEQAVVPTGDLDAATNDALETEVRDLYASGAARVVVDLRGVEFIDSSGLRTLMSLRNEARRRGRGLALVPGPPGVQRIFALTATRGLFDWQDDREAG